MTKLNEMLDSLSPEQLQERENSVLDEARKKKAEIFE